MKSNIHKTTTTTATNMFSKMTWFIRYDRDDEQIEGISSLVQLFNLSIIRYITEFYHKKVYQRIP